MLLSQFEWKSRDSPTKTRLTDRYRSLSFVTPANFPRAVTVPRMANDVTYTMYVALPSITCTIYGYISLSHYTLYVYGVVHVENVVSLFSSPSTSSQKVRKCGGHNFLSQAILGVKVPLVPLKHAVLHAFSLFVQIPRRTRERA